MHETTGMGARGILKIGCVALMTLFVAFISYRAGFDQPQIISATVFILIVSSTVFFYDLHLPIAFVGIALLLALDVMDLPRLVAKSHLDVILFLVGMMVLVGILKELGLSAGLLFQSSPPPT